MITESALKSWAMQQDLSVEVAVSGGDISFTVDYMDSLDESPRFSARGLYDDGRHYYDEGNSNFYMRSSNYKIDPDTMKKFSDYMRNKVPEFIIKEGMGNCVGMVTDTVVRNGLADLELILMGVRCNNIREFENRLYNSFEVWRKVCLEARNFPGIKFENKDHPARNQKNLYGRFKYDSSNRKISSNSGGCYITTAVCQTLGRPDDCYELKTFREYRDNWLIKQPDGKDIIREYYNIAPRIVETIDNLKDAPDVYKEIWNSYLNKCLTMIEEHRPYDCKKLYMDMVNDLRLKHNIN